MKAWEKFKIMQEALPLLGTMPDTALAKKLGVTRVRIANWRRDAGIASWRQQQNYTHTELPDEVQSLLGTMPDGKLAKKLGISLHTVRRWRIRAGIPRWHKQQKAAAMPLLGTMKDAALARKLGLSRSTIEKLRNGAGIPRYIKPFTETKPQRQRARIKELEAEVARLQNLNKEKAQ